MTKPRSPALPALAMLLLLAGIWRLYSLVLHEPLLAYANNHDMVRLQACHAIWPADPAIAPGASTPAAPLEHYRIRPDVLPPTSCLASSERLFTSAGVHAAAILSLQGDDGTLSIRVFGFVRAIILSLTALLASLWWWRRGNHRALLGHAVVFTGVLADPGITLYLNTFYSEFSAAYFLYLSLLGLAVLAQAGWQPRGSLVLMAGLAGLTLSKPQHMPLACLLALVVAGQLLYRHRTALAMAVIAAALVPVLLQTGGVLHSRDATMAAANKTNMLGALLASNPDGQRPAILQVLALPKHCLALADTNWVKALRAGEPVPCPEAASIRYTAVAGLLLSTPGLLLHTVADAVPKTRRWLMGFYGQVAGQQQGLASDYHWSVYALIKPVPEPAYVLLFCLPALVALASLAQALYRQRAAGPAVQWLALLVVLQWAVLVVAVVGDGFVDIAKHSHLAVALLLAWYLLAGTDALHGFSRKRGQSRFNNTTAP